MTPIFDFIDGRGDSPFFIWYAPFLPHTPHNPPTRLLEKYTAPERPVELARYYAMCEWFDETCGQLLAFLDERTLSRDTLVVFVTDNGWMQRTPQTEVPEAWPFQFAPKSKRSPYDGGIRTPIMVRWLGKIAPGRFQTPVSSVDLAPTILAAAGLRPPDEMPGINLIDVADAGGRCARQAIFGEIFAHDVADVDEPAESLLYRWCVESSWKLILPSGASQPPELYNLDADPHETNNLADARPEVVARLTKMTDSWWQGR